VSEPRLFRVRRFLSCTVRAERQCPKRRQSTMDRTGTGFSLLSQKHVLPAKPPRAPSIFNTIPAKTGRPRLFEKGSRSRHAQQAQQRLASAATSAPACAFGLDRPGHPARRLSTRQRLQQRVVRQLPRARVRNRRCKLSSGYLASHGRASTQVADGHTQTHGRTCAPHTRTRADVALPVFLEQPCSNRRCCCGRQHHAPCGREASGLLGRL
jgi:hypothetical protein